MKPDDWEEQRRRDQQAWSWPLWLVVAACTAIFVLWRYL